MREKKTPVFDKNVYLMQGAVVTGDVHLGEGCNVWQNAVIRGDLGPIRIGAYTNIQECCVLHLDEDGPPVILADHVTVGHGCILHGCSVGRGSLVGMGSIVMDGAQIGEGCVVGAGSLVTSNTVIPDGMMAFGRPAKPVRPTTEAERQMNLQHAEEYTELAEETRGA